MLPCFLLPGEDSRLNMLSGWSSAMERQGLVILAPAVLSAGFGSSARRDKMCKTRCTLAKIGYKGSHDRWVAMFIVTGLMSD